MVPKIVSSKWLHIYHTTHSHVELKMSMCHRSASSSPHRWQTQLLHARMHTHESKTRAAMTHNMSFPLWSWFFIFSLFNICSDTTKPNLNLTCIFLLHYDDLIWYTSLSIFVNMQATETVTGRSLMYSAQSHWWDSSSSDWQHNTAHPCWQSGSKN